MKNNNNEKGVIMCRIVKIVIGGLLLLIVTTPTPAWAYAFNVNTASLFGTTATLAFDFTNGDIAVNNKVQISNSVPMAVLLPLTVMAQTMYPAYCIHR